MATIRWIAALSPLWASMAVTTNLDDGNTGTNVSSADSDSVGASADCQTEYLSAPITAEARSTNEQSVTAWRARGSLALQLTQTQAFCAPPADADPPTTGGTAVITLQYWDGLAWIPVDSYSPTVPTLVYAMTTTEAFDTGTRTISQLACRARVVIDYQYTWTGSNNTITATTTLSEWGLTMSDTGDVCGDDGTGTTTPPASECSCEWSEVAPVSTTWSRREC